MNGYEPPPKFPNMSSDMCMYISDYAELGITKDEICQGNSLEWEQLSIAEKNYFNREYNRGKLRGIATVAKHVVKHSSNPNGLQATMAYLRRFASNYEKDLTTDATSTAEAFSFYFNDKQDKPDKPAKPAKPTAKPTPSNGKSSAAEHKLS